MARILETVFSETKEPAAQALAALVPHIPQVTRRWRASLRTLNLSPKARRVFIQIDLQQALQKLSTISYSGLRNSLKHLAAEFVAADIESEQALGAFHLLFDQCLPYFKDDPEAAIAVTRLAGVISGMVVAGYSARWESSRLFLSHRLVDARRRLHGASAYVTQVYEMERRRLSHDLHDEIGHDLVLLKLYLEVILRDRLEGEALTSKIEQSLGVLQHALDSARRLVLDLGPPIFDELGFMGAMRSYARQFGQRTGVEVEFRAGPLPEEIPMSHQIALYRVLQGALGNVFKHANAKRVTVTLGRVRNGELFLVVQDDGTGFDMNRRRKEASVGLIAMRERVEVLGGSFLIDSVEVGPLQRRHGTRVEIGLPLPRVQAIRREKKQAARTS